jgi:hypothetical protein
MMTATSLAKAEGMKPDPADAACPDGVCPGLGNVFYLPELNALSTNTGGMKVFRDTTLNGCAKFQRNIGQASREFHTEESMNSFVRSVSSSLSLGGTFASKKMSVQASARLTTGTESSYTGTFHSVTLDVSQVFATADFNRTDKCLNARNLSPDFLRAFEALPLIKPENAGEPASWDAYVQFLKNDGSHVMIQQQIGSRFQQWESSRSEESDIETKLRARACANVESREAGKKRKRGWSANGCARYSKEVRESTADASDRSKTVIRGGTDETRNELEKGVTPERLNAFIDSGRLGNQAIRYTFTPIWGILDRVYRTQCSKSGAGSPACENLQRSRNLQAAYEGWLAIECGLNRSDNVTYQEMRTTGKPNELGIYSYQCWARKTGCVQNRDCRVGGAGSVCYCYGATCFDIGDPIVGMEVNRTKVRGSRSGNYNQGVNNSCYYRVGVTCRCNESWRGGLPDRALYLQSSN